MTQLKLIGLYVGFIVIGLVAQYGIFLIFDISNNIDWLSQLVREYGYPFITIKDFGINILFLICITSLYKLLYFKTAHIVTKIKTVLCLTAPSVILNLILLFGSIKLALGFDIGIFDKFDANRIVINMLYVLWLPFLYATFSKFDAKAS